MSKTIEFNRITLMYARTQGRTYLEGYADNEFADLLAGVTGGTFEDREKARLFINNSEEEIDMGVLMKGTDGEITIGGRGWSLNHPPESMSKRKHSEIKNRTAKIFSEEYPNETFRVDLG